MNNQLTKYPQQNAIEVREFLEIIWKNKYFILAFTFVFSILAMFFILRQKPIYEAKAFIDLGYYYKDAESNCSGYIKTQENQKIIIQDAKELSKRLQVLYIDLPKNRKERDSEIIKILVPKEQKSLLEVTAQGKSNELAIKEIYDVVKYISKQDQKVLDDVKQRRETQIKNITMQIDTIRNRKLKHIDEKIIEYKSMIRECNKQLILMGENLVKIKRLDPTLAALELMRKRETLSSLIELKREIGELEDKKDELNTTLLPQLLEKKNILEALLLPKNLRSSYVIKGVSRSDTPVEPKKKLLIAVFALTGLMLSSAIALLWSLSGKEKRA